MKLSTQQTEVLNNLEVIHKAQYDVFILKGYAGTGKTTILKNLVDHFEEKELEFCLMATTGRAAKVLKNKTGQDASTIHSYIYKLVEVEEGEEEVINKFSLRENEDSTSTVYIVDESSMLGNKNLMSEMLEFGTGRLLTDLLTFTKKRKVIFVGDTAQLPPINSKIMPALTAEYLNDKFDKIISEYELTQIFRQEEESQISKSAFQLRNIIKEEAIPPLSVRTKNSKDITVYPKYGISNMTANYVHFFNKEGAESSIFIAFTNKMVSELNISIRKRLFKNLDMPNPKEVLMIVQNNAKHNLTNGERVQIIEIDTSIYKKADLSFVDVLVRDLEDEKARPFKAKLILDLINSDKRSLEVYQEAKLLKDFRDRMKGERVRSGSPEYLESKQKDPWLNALRAKYGYAITCHKSQGGEWNNVFLIMQQVLFHQEIKTQYRWTYTAITRTAKRLHIADNERLY